jgi:hypothetical protein
MLQALGYVIHCKGWYLQPQPFAWRTVEGYQWDYSLEISSEDEAVDLILIFTLDTGYTCNQQIHLLQTTHVRTISQFVENVMTRGVSSFPPQLGKNVLSDRTSGLPCQETSTVLDP